MNLSRASVFASCFLLFAACGSDSGGRDRAGGEAAEGEGEEGEGEGEGEEGGGEGGEGEEGEGEEGEGEEGEGEGSEGGGEGGEGEEGEGEEGEGEEGEGEGEGEEGEGEEGEGEGEGCPDADEDDVCDVADDVCNLDGQPIACRAQTPICEDGEVPEAANGCWTGRCLGWDDCAVDTDEDGVLDALDTCPADPEAPQTDQDADGVGDACDNCPELPNADQRDADGDGTGDACGEQVEDRDFDNVPDDEDNCPDIPNEFQDDIDGDGLGDSCDPCVLDPNNSDADGDFICDRDDAVCNPDNSPVVCMVIPPECPDGEVPSATNGCYDGNCVTWDACAELGEGEPGEGRECVAHESICPFGTWCGELVCADEWAPEGPCSGVCVEGEDPCVAMDCEADCKSGRCVPFDWGR